MHPALRAALAAGGGIVRWDPTGPVPRWALDDGRRSGSLVRLLPGVFVDASQVADPDVLWRAALVYCGETGALSHTSALAVWGLCASAPDTDHVTVPRTSSARSYGRLVAHRVAGFAAEAPQVVLRAGLRVTRLERSLVEAWPLLPAVARREPVIRAVNDRMTTPERISAALADLPRLTGRAELRELVDRLAAGCRSELEIWGHDHVFSGPGMPALARQVPVRLDGRTIYLDVYAEAERVAFELDGAAHHGDRGQRERDIARDAALLARGIVVVRPAHRRLVTDPAGVRRQVLEILHDRGQRIGESGGLLPRSAAPDLEEQRWRR